MAINKLYIPWIATVVLAMVLGFLTFFIVLPPTIYVTTISTEIDNANTHTQEGVCYVYNHTIEELYCGVGCSTIKVDCNGETRICYKVSTHVILSKKLLTNPEVGGNSNGRLPYLTRFIKWGVTYDIANQTIYEKPIGYYANCYYDRSDMNDIIWTEEENNDKYKPALGLLWPTFALLLIGTGVLTFVSILWFSCYCANNVPLIIKKPKLTAAMAANQV
jgi:hypothetical protein